MPAKADECQNGPIFIHMNRQWFEDWFNSEQYYQLYEKRNDDEANSFLSNLCAYLSLPKGSTVLDAPCGNGRHAAFLNEKGFKVSGFDLAEKNIALCKARNIDVEFFKHDIRHVVPHGPFDLVLNLFTSLGYFEDQKENQLAVHQLATSLKNDGILVIDFFNATLTLKNLVPKETVSKQNHFEISRQVEGKTIVKTIETKVNGELRYFEERVVAYSMGDLVNMVEEEGLEVMDCFGDYHLGDFDNDTSPRAILVAKKARV